MAKGGRSGYKKIKMLKVNIQNASHLQKQRHDRRQKRSSAKEKEQKHKVENG